MFEDQDNALSEGISPLSVLLPSSEGIFIF